jgi:peptidoglycan-associated lipoprotein
MNPDTRLFSFVLVAALSSALGCASATTPPDPVTGEAAGPTPEHKAELSRGGPGAPELTPIYFDTDRSVLRAEARKTLQGYAAVIKEHPEWGLVAIEGHCDDRGSEEYNMALGARRAAAVKRYLADLGVPAARLATRTFGEERPAVVGHNERAWRQNRRTELQSEARDSARR